MENTVPTRSYLYDRQGARIHGDWCGPITPATPSGDKYFFLVVDDFSRYMCIVLLKSKHQTLQAFMIIKTAAEVKAEVKLKTFRMDRG
jgi:hypothetical protein